MPFTKKETELINKYYSKPYPIESDDVDDIRNLKNHIYKVSKISKDIVSLYNDLCEKEHIDGVISNEEVFAIKYASLFHDVGKTDIWKINGKDMHIEKGIKIITSTKFKKDFIKTIDNFLSDTELEEILGYIMSAIQSHKSFRLSNGEHESSFVSAIVYASDKIAHIDKHKNYEKRKKAYTKTKQQIYKLIQEINTMYEYDENWQVLISCILQILKNSVPLESDTWTIFGEKQ